jgi:hypothetical protein
MTELLRHDCDPGYLPCRIDAVDMVTAKDFARVPLSMLSTEGWTHPL